MLIEIGKVRADRLDECRESLQEFIGCVRIVSDSPDNIKTARILIDAKCSKKRQNEVVAFLAGWNAAHSLLKWRNHESI